MQFLVLFPLLAASVAIWLRVAMNWSARVPPLAYLERREPRWNRPVVVFTVTMLIYFVVMAAWPRKAAAPPTPTQIQYALLLDCLSRLLMLVIIIALLMYGTDSTLADFGITLVDLKRQVQAGALGFAASLAPVFAVSLMLAPFKSEKTQHPLLRLLSESPTLETIFWSVAAAVVVAPLVEELLFRVVLQGWLKTVIAPRWAIGITSVLFGFVHGFPDAIPLVVLAIVLGYVYQQRNSYAAVVTMHGLFNAFNLTLLLLGGPPPTP